jgi:hypothetical protein
VFAKRRFPRRVHPGVYCAIDKRFPGRFPGLHDEGHCPDAEQNGKKARSQGSVTSKEEAYQNREAGDGEPDDRYMIEGQMEMSR